MIRPGRALMTMTRSDRKIASSIWWVMNRTVLCGRRPDPQQLGLHELAGLGVERGERLVHEQQLRVDGERPGQVGALLHAARQLVGVLVLEARQPDQLDQGHARVPGPACAARPGRPGRRRRCRGPCTRGRARNPGRPSRGPGLLAGLADLDLPVGRGEQAVDDLCEGRLAAAAWPDDRDELVRRDVEVDRSIATRRSRVDRSRYSMRMPRALRARPSSASGQFSSWPVASAGSTSRRGGAPRPRRCPSR